MDPIPDDLRFPAPPDDPGRASDETIAAFVRDVLDWQNRLGYTLQSDRASLPGLTDRAVDLLLQFLEPRDVAPAPLFSSPYRLHSFPATLPPDRRAFDLLMRWRAGFADFLADIWDVVGTPAYSRAECRAMERFLEPLDAEERCASCLARLPARQRHESAHPCPMFAYITENWPGFAEIQRQFPRPAPTFRIVHGEPYTTPGPTPRPPKKPAPPRRPSRRNAATDRFTHILASAAPRAPAPATTADPRDRSLVPLAVVVGLLLCAFAALAPATSPRLLVAALGLGCLIAGALLHVAERRQP